MAKEKGARLNAVKFGIAGGIIWAALVLFVTALSGYFPTWFSLFSECYGMLGYSASFLGAILGVIYGFIDGFILMWVFALIYNKLL